MSIPGDRYTALTGLKTQLKEAGIQGKELIPPKVLI
jgi:hypothetical protein